MMYLWTHGNQATRNNLRNLRSFGWPLHLTITEFALRRSGPLSQRFPQFKLNFSKVSGLPATAYANRVGSVLLPSSEFHTAGVFRWLPLEHKAFLTPVQRCIATASSPSSSASAEPIVAKPLTGNTSPADRPDHDAVGPSKFRLLEIDVEDMEKQRRKFIKRNNFYGVLAPPSIFEASVASIHMIPHESPFSGTQKPLFYECRPSLCLLHSLQNAGMPASTREGA